MNLEQKNRELLIKHRLEQADETIDDVQLLVDNERFRAAINRIYYGMFYTLLALGLKKGFATSKHSQLIGWFNKEYIKTNLLDRSLGRIITNAYNRRTKGDYDSFIEFDKETVKEKFDEMKVFIESIKKYLKEE